ncbi:hypothetical protein HJG60_008912 [Phyllostomus discolor]|uniref:Uncharacterized protein n=1 Tax=Phyllostomus discolor TaxID=89673 RepID=A0A833YZB4_9CHIR|nr:hypothetical protein HJG60_008912 [Phyllostomus discolor]
MWPVGQKGGNKSAEVDLKALVYQDLKLGFCPGVTGSDWKGLVKDVTQSSWHHEDSPPCGEQIQRQAAPGAEAGEIAPWRANKTGPRELVQGWGEVADSSDQFLNRICWNLGPIGEERSYNEGFTDISRRTLSEAKSPGLR